MSDLGQPSPAPSPPRPADPAKQSEIPLWVLFSAIGVLALGAVVSGVVFLAGGIDKARTSGIAYPATWDPRIKPYVDIVEKERGLRFQHPVAVRFLPDAAFKKTLTAEQGNLDAAAKADIAHSTALFRAFGLIKGNVDLFAAFNDAHSSGTLAYYSFDDQRVTVRGTRITLASHATLVHELTHAVEDQQFDIGKRLNDLQDAQQNGSTTTEADVFDAIIEGDASRTATLYRESLKPAARRALVRAESALPADDSKVLAGVPKAVLAFLGAPYALGEAMVQAVAANGGNHAVDNLLREAPTHDSALLDPFEVLSGDTGAAHVAMPTLKDGEKKFDSGEFGALTWYLMLAGRMPLRDALAAADGWNGDAYVGFERNHQTCARIAYAGDSATDTNRMYAALNRWISAVPGTPASVLLAGERVVFETCDPGTTTGTGNDAATQAVGLAATRAYLAIGIMGQGAPVKAARCIAGKMVDVYSVAQLNDPKFGAHDPAVTAKVRQLALGCR